MRGLGIRKTNVATNPAHCKTLEQWLKSYRPEELFDAGGKLLQDLSALAPKRQRRMGAIRTPMAASC